MSVLQNAIIEIQKQIRTLPGIRSAPDSPTPRVDAYPFVVTYLGEGQWSEEPAGMKTGLHVLIVELHVVTKDQPRDVTTAMEYAESLPNLLFKRLDIDSWAGTVQTVEAISYTFGALGWGDVDTLGFRFRIRGVKVQSAIT